MLELGRSTLSPSRTFSGSLPCPLQVQMSSGRAEAPSPSPRRCQDSEARRSVAPAAVKLLHFKINLESIKQPRNISHTAASPTYTDTRERNEEEASHHMITSSLLPNCEPHKHPSVPSSRFLSDGCANRACHLSEAQGHQVAGIHRQINLTAANAYSTRSKLEKDDERQRDEPHHSSQYSSHSRSISTRTSTQHHAAHGITHAHVPHV